MTIPSGMKQQNKLSTLTQLHQLCIPKKVQYLVNPKMLILKINYSKRMMIIIVENYLEMMAKIQCLAIILIFTQRVLAIRKDQIDLRTN